METRKAQDARFSAAPGHLALGRRETRQAVLAACGYDSVIAMPGDVDEKLRSGTFDLAILSVRLTPEEMLVI